MNFGDVLEDFPQEQEDEEMFGCSFLDQESGKETDILIARF